jgi:DNA polymerase I-like protein with 3'-5' exonuclease and polymerase domains
MGSIHGTFTVHGVEYYISLDEGKTKRTWTLANTIHEVDIATRLFGQESQYVELSRTDMFNKSVPQGYIVGSVVQSKATNKLSVYKSAQLISELIEVLQKAQGYGFAKKSILEDSVVSENGVLRKVVSGDDGFMKSRIERKNNQLSYIEIDYQGMQLSMREGSRIRPGFKVEYKTMDELKMSRRKVDMLSTTHSLDYEALKEILDLSWYERNNKVVVDYGSIKSKSEMEAEFIRPFMNLVMENKAKGLKTILVIDSETTGLNFYQLSEGNEFLDKMVALPISWALEQGRIIFTDMEFFDNVDEEYVLRRLRPLIEGATGARTLDMLEIEVLENGEEIEHVVGQWEFDREDIDLTGHNAPFDGRVLYHYDVKSYWNNDTYQMFFNLNPRIAKGAGSLKNLTEKLRGRQSPELSDILGKGNEGNFRMIKDLRVAEIYGCADGDNTYFLRLKAERLMGPRMYRMYQRQDIPILNRLFISEYQGIPINEEEFRKEGAVTEKNMEIITQIIYQHVGSEIERRNIKNSLDQKLKANLLTVKEHAIEVLSIPQNFPNAYREFDLRGDDLRTHLFDILGYKTNVFTKPTKKYPKGQPSVDKGSIESMLKHEWPTPRDIWKYDIKSDSGEVLLSAETLNKKQYPVAYMLSQFKKMDKDWTSYFKPILKNNLEGKMFKSYAMARIETRRIMNPAQTMKASMKYYVESVGKDWYMMDFDQMQAEPRIMVSLSGDLEKILKFSNPEKDYHTETAAAIRKILPHMLSKYFRKIYKEITLGLPYGIGNKKMCIKIHGEFNKETEFKTNVDIVQWKTENAAIWELLKGFQRAPLTQMQMSDEMVDFLWKTTRTEEKPEPRMWGAAKNIFGFYRLFDITDITPGDSKQEGKVMRPAGNYPIQSLAAEIFRNLLKNLHDRCVEEGLVDKIVWHLLIHDELLMSVHNSVHPFMMYKILYESCTVKIKGHVPYFIGINVGDSWGECKEDKNEAPVGFVDDIVKRWDNGEFRDDDYKSDVKGYVRRHMHQYFVNRIGKAVEFHLPKCHEQPLHLPNLLEVFEEYTVRAYVGIQFKPNRNFQGKEGENDHFDACFETWMVEYFGEGKELVQRDGTLKSVYAGSVEKEGATLRLDEEELSSKDKFFEEQEDWTFEENELDEVTYFSTAYEDDETFEERMVREHLEAVESYHSGNALKSAVSFSNVKVSGNFLEVKLPRVIHATQVKRFLNNSRSEEGYEVIFSNPLGSNRWVTISKDTDLEALDKFVGGLK